MSLLKNVSLRVGSKLLRSTAARVVSTPSRPFSASTPSKLKKTTQLKKLICTPGQMGFLMEAHNGLSAKIVEEAGFSGIWGSGLSISAAMGVRDSNEASYTQVLEVMEFMSQNTNIPILLDADTGYG
jgi:2-methylisocitrate lyase-like PEP mutase family enzyme